MTGADAARGSAITRAQALRRRVTVSGTSLPVRVWTRQCPLPEQGALSCSRRGERRGQAALLSSRASASLATAGLEPGSGRPALSVIFHTAIPPMTPAAIM